MDIEDTAKGLIDPASITNQVEAALLRLQPEARAAFAALCAQRLMAWHVRLPAPEQRPYTLTWAPVLETIWTGLGKAVNLDEKAEVRKHLKDFYEVYNQEVDNQEVDNQDRESLTEDADDDTAACSICAAQAFCEDDFKPACSAAFRVIDSIYSQAHDATLKTYPQPSHLEIFFHPMMQQEAQRLMSALEFLKLRPWSPKLVPALRRSFESDGPQRKRRRGEKG